MTVKRLIALILCLMIFSSLLPAAAFADGDEEIIEVPFGTETEEKQPAKQEEEPLPEDGQIFKPAEENTEDSLEEEPAEDGELPYDGESTETEEDGMLPEEPDGEEEENGFESAVASGSCGDGLTYTLDSAGTLTVSGSGYMDSYSLNVNNSPWCPADTSYSIKKIVINPGVESIGSWAFSSCTECTSISIPETVTLIGNGAFDNCRSLTSIQLPSGLTRISEEMFFQCRKLQNIIIPANVRIIGARAFMGCNSLKTITLPANVASIACYVFDECYSLESILTESGNSLFESEDGVLFTAGKATLLYYPPAKSDVSYTVPQGVSAIDSHAFSDCVKLKNVIIPEGVTSLGTGAFSKCTALESVSIPASAENILFPVFVECPNIASLDVAEGHPGCKTVEGVLYSADGAKLIFYPSGRSGKSFTVPDGVSVIACDAFDSNRNLERIKFPEGLKVIESSAFSECKSLAEISLPAGIEKIENYTFWRCPALKAVTLPETVTEIGAEVFAECTALTEINFNGNLTAIGNSAFLRCKSLKKVKLPQSLMFIGEWAFCESGLESVEFPEGLETIELRAFSMCQDLKTVYFTGDAPYIGEGAFCGVAMTAYYPAGNPTWTDSATQAYEGYITWKPLNGIKTPAFTTIANHADYMIVCWNPVDFALSYELAYREGSGAWTVLNVPLTSVDSKGNPRVNIKNLKQGATYTFIAYALFADGTKTKSESAAQTRLLSPTVTAKAGNGYVALSWNEVQGGSQYKIYYREKGGSWQMYAWVKKGVTSINIKESVISANGWTPLIKGHTYEFAVILGTSVAGITSGFPTTPVSVKY